MPIHAIRRNSKTPSMRIAFFIRGDALLIWLAAAHPASRFPPAKVTNGPSHDPSPGTGYYIRRGCASKAHPVSIGKAANRKQPVTLQRMAAKRKFESMTEMEQFFIEAGRTGGKKTAANRTKAQRSEAASKAAKARWAKAKKVAKGKKKKNK
jgi:hypothetical protein